MIGNRKYLITEPFYLQWHITDRCALSCQHCYRKEKKTKDLSYPQLLIILEQFQNLLKSIQQKGRIHLTGGEPFLSEHLFDLIRDAQAQKLPVRILSSGVGVNDRHIQLLRRTKCRLVQISIEGKQPTHDRIRGQGSYDQALRTIKKLKEHRIEVTINMTLSKYNYKEIKDVIQLALKEADRFAFSRLILQGSAKEKMQQEMLTPKELKSVFRQVYRLKNKYHQIDIPLRDPIWHEFLHVKPKCADSMVHGCSIGYSGLTVDVDGTIFPCRRLPIPIGNLFKDDLVDIWNHSPVLNQLRDRDLLKGSCQNCDQRWLCGGCRAVAFSIENDFLAEDPQCFKTHSIFSHFLSNKSPL